MFFNNPLRKKKTKTDKMGGFAESGRTMLEVIMALLLLGMISVGGYAGVRYGLGLSQAWRAQAQVNQLAKDVMSLYAWQDSYATLSMRGTRGICNTIVTPGNQDCEITSPWNQKVSVSKGKSNASFKITLHDTPKNICEHLKEMRFENVYMASTSCSGGLQDVEFVMDKDDRSCPEGCPSGYDCINGVCRPGDREDSCKNINCVGECLSGVCRAGTCLRKMNGSSCSIGVCHEGVCVEETTTEETTTEEDTTTTEETTTTPEETTTANCSKNEDCGYNEYCRILFMDSSCATYGAGLCTSLSNAQSKTAGLMGYLTKSTDQMAYFGAQNFCSAKGLRMIQVSDFGCGYNFVGNSQQGYCNTNTDITYSGTRSDRMKAVMPLFGSGFAWTSDRWGSCMSYRVTLQTGDVSWADRTNTYGYALCTGGDVATTTPAETTTTEGDTTTPDTTTTAEDTTTYTDTDCTDKPLIDTYGSCHSCDDPAAVYLNGIPGNCSICPERSLYYDSGVFPYCILSTCPSGKPLKDWYGGCYSCTDPNPIRVQGKPQNCAVCNNRTLTSYQDYCYIPCGSNQFTSSSGMCYDCTSGQSVTVVSGATDCLTNCPNRVLEYRSGYGTKCRIPCGQAGTVNENKPLTSVDGSCYACTDYIDYVSVPSGTDCASICPGTEYTNGYCRKGCDAYSMRDTYNNCVSCNSGSDIYVNSTDASKCSFCDGTGGKAKRYLQGRYCVQSCKGGATPNSATGRCECPSSAPLGTDSACYSCSTAGTINLWGVLSDTCKTACPGERYVSQSQYCDKCAAGTYSPSGTSCVACPAAKSSLTRQGDCKACGGTWNGSKCS